MAMAVPKDDEAIEVGRRAHPRIRVQLPASLVAVHDTQHVQLLSLSPWGAGVAWRQPLPPLTEVMIRCVGTELYGTVKWAREELGGVMFDTPLPELFIVSVREHSESVRIGRCRDETMFALRNWKRTGGRY